MIVPDLLERTARECSAVVAFRDTQRSVTAAGSVDAIDGLAQRLTAAGLESGDRLMVVSENDVATPLLLLAAHRLGAVPAIVNARVGATELAAMRECVRPRLAVYAIEASPTASSLAASVTTTSWEDLVTGRLLLEVSAPRADADEIPSDVGLLLFTSGTTGQAKAVMWSHTGLIELGRVLAQTRATTAGSVVQCAGPLSHIMGISNLMSALVAGATLQLMPRLDAAALVAAVMAGEVTHISLVPTAYRRLCDHLESAGQSLVGTGLRYVSCGGAPLDQALKTRVERLFGLRLVNGYGMTECAPVSRTRPDQEAPADCIGWPEPGVELRIDAPAGETVGELLIRSKTRMVGYFDAPQETAAMLRTDGWVASGDLAMQMPNAAFRLVGRCKDLIIRSGFNVYPAEVEAALYALPQVRQAAVIGCPADDANEEIVAFVSLRDGYAADAGAIRAALRESLAPYKRPARIEFLQELPLGATGKIAKQLLWQRLVR